MDAGSHVSSPDARRVWERVLRPLGEDLVHRAYELSVMLQARIGPQLPELFTDPESAEANRASAEASIRAVGELIACGDEARNIELPPETVAFGRQGARQRLPLTAMMRSYRLGHAALWDVVVSELAVRAADRDELALATSMSAAWLFAYVDEALILVDQLYADERERFARSAAARRAETISAILEGHLLDARAAGRRLGYELDREHLGTCVWLEHAPEDTDQLGLLESAIGEVARTAGVAGALVHPLGVLAAAGWLSSVAPLDLDALEALRLDTNLFPGIRVAIGEPAHGIAGFRSTHGEALHARRVATLSGRPPGSLTRYRGVALQALASVDPDQLHAFVHRVLVELAARDDTTLRLATTLRAYLEEHCSRSRTSRRLGVHENTISYRIRQVEELLGRSVESDTLDLRVALALAPVTRERRTTSR